MMAGQRSDRESQQYATSGHQHHGSDPAFMYPVVKQDRHGQTSRQKRRGTRKYQQRESGDHFQARNPSRSRTRYQPARDRAVRPVTAIEFRIENRSEERRVGKEWRSWSMA